MVSVYTDADYLSAYKQKQRIFWTGLGISIAYVLFCVGWLIYYITLPYKDPMQALPKTCVYVMTALYIAFIFPFFAIKFSRANRYYKMLGYVCEGIKVEECNYFYCFREKSLQKENIDVISCIFETWSKKKQEWMEREVYFDVEKPLPDFGEGDLVRYIAQSNFIVQYEILERHAYEFEECDEEQDDEEAGNDEENENRESAEKEREGEELL